jgi:hypothetical protein
MFNYLLADFWSKLLARRQKDAQMPLQQLVVMVLIGASSCAFFVLMSFLFAAGAFSSDVKTCPHFCTFLYVSGACSAMALIVTVISPFKRYVNESTSGTMLKVHYSTFIFDAAACSFCCEFCLSCHLILPCP